jgi:hypothetical protein
LPSNPTSVLKGTSIAGGAALAFVDFVFVTLGVDYSG